jgi:hypothetical protein
VKQAGRWAVRQLRASPRGSVSAAGSRAVGRRSGAEAEAEPAAGESKQDAGELQSYARGPVPSAGEYLAHAEEWVPAVVESEGPVARSARVPVVGGSSCGGCRSPRAAGRASPTASPWPRTWRRGGVSSGRQSWRAGPAEPSSRGPGSRPAFSVQGPWRCGTECVPVDPWSSSPTHVHPCDGRCRRGLFLTGRSRGLRSSSCGHSPAPLTAADVERSWRASVRVGGTSRGPTRRG